MHTYRTLVTPAMAQAWLNNNHPKNRKMSRASIARLAKDMLDGNWLLTHQGVCLGRNGVLIDGQHRLSAVVLSGAAVEMLVTTDDSLESPKGLPVDLHDKRPAAFVLGVPRAVAAMASLAYHVAQQHPGSPAQIAPYAEMLAPLYDRLLPEGSRTARKKFSAAPVVLAGCLRMAQNPGCDEYYRGVFQALLRNDPAALGRGRVYSLYRQVADRNWPQRELLAKAWRAFDYHARDVEKTLHVKSVEGVLAEVIEAVKAQLAV